MYFTDVGLVCYLTGVSAAQPAQFGPLAGPLLETAVVTEIIKTLTHRGVDPQVHFWRTATGTEVDLVVETAGQLVPVEVRLSATPRPAMASSIRMLQTDLGQQVRPGYVVHPGRLRLPLGPHATALPFTDL